MALLRSLERDPEALRQTPPRSLDLLRAGLVQRVERVADVALGRAGECWIAAEVKLAAELKKLPKASGSKGQFLGGSNKAPPRTKEKDPTPSLAELGVAKKRAARAKRIAEIPQPKRKQFTEELKAQDKAVTPDALLRKQREENKATKKHDVVTAVFSADGPFHCVVIDPPWKMAKIDRDVRPNQDAFDYPTMSEGELVAFWRADMAPRIASDCHLFMWTTQKFLPTAINLLGLFGFRYVLTMVWHKAGGFQPIDLPQYNCEFIVYGRRGAAGSGLKGARAA